MLLPTLTVALSPTIPMLSIDLVMLIPMVLLQLLCLPQVLEHFFQITKDLHKPRIVSNQVVLSKKKTIEEAIKDDRPLQLQQLEYFL